MSGIGTFLLVVAAFIGTVELFANNAGKIGKLMDGKTWDQVTSEVGKTWEENPGKVISRGCGCCWGVLLGLLYTFLVEPAVVITAIVAKIGYQPLAYAMLVIIAIEWIVAIHSYSTASKTSEPATASVATKDGQVVKGKVVSTDKKIDMGSHTWTNIRRVFFSLPTLYFWYVFLVLIRLVK